MDYIKTVTSGADVLDGYRIHGVNMDDVESWLQRIGIEVKKTEKTPFVTNANSGNSYENGIIPDEYETPADEQGSLQKITYDTWESFTYDQKSHILLKT